MFKDKQLRADVDIKMKQFENNMEARLIEFHKEITNKYFEALEKIFRLNKEVSLINTLANQVSKKDITALNAGLMQPILAARWKEQEEHNGEKIMNKGERVIDKRKSLHEDILMKEKRGIDVKDLKQQLVSLDWVIKELTK